jgi:predicted anti-sigma-YlaC factor YlaD
MAKLTDPVRPNCVSAEEIALYFAGEVPQEKHVAIENHLLECEYCCALSEQVADIAQELYERELNLEFLTTTDLSAFGLSNKSAILERIERWIRTGAELAVGLLLPVKGPISFMTSGIKDMLSPLSGFSLEQARGATLLGASGTENGNLEGPILEIPGQGRRRARVVVDVGAVTHVSVQIDSVPAAMVPPLAAVRWNDPPQVLMKEMVRVQSLSGDPSLTDLIAEFDVPETVHEVLVVVEPLTND